ncbi:delta-aminolevulinic acid dehydratase [Acidilobus saccharovorans 345-15]|uniref:Delta-aminolevulinic acid dehydratase n=1 Tax=Acidilobus saccharovorans (strain DSM 16705 / JCM 18335 / VKM B-2471 / 345-15) TaxID=666510 RepID=D9PZM4_ACIS3|nr:porphobilinogen synthase [Acidilobus saccharovorans]ADL18512.1 delta-aminolevulinic acid dehydratase [Acidilobus saccharovorans 345-15]
MTGFPRIRPRRLRSSSALRSLIAEVDLSPSRFIMPLFVDENLKSPIPTPGLEGYTTYPPDSKELINLVNAAMEVGVKSFLIFGVPSTKDEVGSRAFAEDGPVQRALRTIRSEVGWEPVLMTDLCICEYTSHGHCGIPVNSRRGTVIDNDSTLKVYQKIAVSQAQAGADFIAPSGMMDGQVRAIREALDTAGFTDVGIMAYSAKYASSMYGPFREAVDSAPRFGDRKSYQMDPRNAREAIKEVRLDLEEGADIVMVKPALMYLDVISLVKRTYPDVPLAAYNVSGEYAMIKAAARQGLIDGVAAMMEALYAIRRAGADMIITYFALDAARAIASGKSPF